MKKINRYMILISFVTVIVCIMLLYVTDEHYSIKKEKVNVNTVAINESNDEDINLGAAAAHGGGGGSSSSSNSSSTTIRCDPGMYLSGGVCSRCNVGHRCLNNAQIACTGIQYQDQTGQSYCKTCPSDKEVNSSHTGCEYVCSTSASLMASQKVVSVGDNVWYRANWEKCEDGVTITTSNCGSPSSSGGSQTSGTSGGHTTTTSPGWCKITVTGKGSTSTASICVVGEWKAGKGAAFAKGSIKHSSLAADAVPVNKYGEGCYDTGEGLEVCPTVYTRAGGCASAGPSPAKTYDFCCVNNGYVGVSSEVHWLEYKKYESCEKYYPGKGYTLLKTTKAECKGINDVSAVTCNESNLTPVAQNPEAKVCEDNVSIILNEQLCTSAKTNETFYKINCDRTVDANFDYGDDDDVAKKIIINKGQGFKFAINVQTKLHCEGTFNVTRWKEVYNTFTKKTIALEYGYTKHKNGLIYYVENYDPDKPIESKKKFQNYIENNLKKELYDKNVGTMGKTAATRISNESAKKAFELWNTYYEPLLNALKTYNETEASQKYNESATLEIPITVKGKKAAETKVNAKFDTLEIDKGEYKTITSTTLNLGVKNLKNPKNYVKSNESKPRKVKLVPQLTYLIKTTGELTKNNKELAGGRRIYIDNNTENKEYTMKIKVTGLGANESTITNEKCSFSVGDIDLLYRPIELNNPFINDSWKKGENWVNSKYDFTKTIHANTWSEGKIATVTISADQISQLQKSTKDYVRSNISPYLGLCETLAETSQDSITKTICNTLKSISN